MKTISRRIFLLSAFFLLTSSVNAAGSDAEIPFKFEKGHVIVSATIRGNTPVEVELATGAEHSLINVEVLEKYKLKKSYTGEGIITGSILDRVVTFVTVTDLSVGEVNAPTLYMRLGAHAATLVSERIGREVFAILGADFFKGRVVQFDFRKRTVRFMTHAPDQSGLVSVNFASLKMRPSSNPVVLPITEEVTVGGKKLKALFDTSALTVVSLTPSAAKQVGLTPPPDKGPPRTDKTSLRFGEIEFADVPVTLHAKDSDFDHDSNGYVAVVGVAMLQNFIVTFDFARGLISLERI